MRNVIVALGAALAAIAAPAEARIVRIEVQAVEPFKGREEMTIDEIVRPDFVAP
jgi:hypothetical protein